LSEEEMAEAAVAKPAGQADPNVVKH
jgi:hypothetical protein